MHGTQANRTPVTPNLILQTSIFSRTRIGIQKRILPVTGTNHSKRRCDVYKTYLPHFIKRSRNSRRLVK